MPENPSASDAWKSEYLEIVGKKSLGMVQAIVGINGEGMKERVNDLDFRGLSQLYTCFDEAGDFLSPCASDPASQNLTDPRRVWLEQYGPELRVLMDAKAGTLGHAELIVSPEVHTAEDVHHVITQLGALPGEIALWDSKRCGMALKFLACLRAFCHVQLAGILGIHNAEIEQLEFAIAEQKWKAFGPLGEVLLREQQRTGGETGNPINPPLE